MEGNKRNTADDAVGALADAAPEGKKQKVNASSAETGGSRNEETKDDDGDVALDAQQLAKKFPSLKECLEKTDVPILALLFAATWCDDCQVAFPAFQEIVSSQNEKEEKVFDLMYVASDKSAEEMATILADNSDWKSIPFQNEDERSGLKRHFGVCAKKEMETLGMSTEDRKSGIPVMLLLEKSSGKILLADAMPDIIGDTKLENPVSKWKAMVSA